MLLLVVKVHLLMIHLLLVLLLPSTRRRWENRVRAMCNQLFLIQSCTVRFRAFATRLVSLPATFRR